jgi:hypothetical protein
MNDPTESIRKQRIKEIESSNTSRAALESQYRRVWTTQELTSEFDVIGFMAPLVVVKRKSDQVAGSMEFATSPERLYFNFQPE